jgi:hypothetical protein
MSCSSSNLVELLLIIAAGSLCSTIWSSPLLLAPFALTLLQRSGCVTARLLSGSDGKGKPDDPIEGKLQDTADCMLACIWECAVPHAGRFDTPANAASAAAVGECKACMAEWVGKDSDAGFGAAPALATIPDRLGHSSSLDIDAALSAVTMSEKVVGHRFAARWLKCVQTFTRSSETGKVTIPRVGPTEQPKIVLWDSLKHELVLICLGDIPATIRLFVSHVALDVAVVP